ncbi:aminotransferase class V-fold PLP-dependent enzyme [Alteromonas genovensis]|uniref:cysteine desulfurase n=1 Tax=Alteromonas genovensis TaxID=471225 RepID=A0A6N9TF81_9ALTE|nr:cysteine desulfurase family protein [Alteromonas genovensis]NDW15801.1 aminotransferase class V-fold PLP-dependent enzyme [Alteromonas genovensis]
MIYFDSAGSFPVLDEARDAFINSVSKYSANPSSDHAAGVEAFEEIEKVRELIADMIGASPSEIVFTSGATESNNLALKGLLNSKLLENKKHIITSQAEHKCILSICGYLETIGYSVTYLKPNADGIITADEVIKAFRADTAIVSIMHVNNELGTINPIAEIGEACFEHNIYFHTDAAQSFAKLAIDVDGLNVDLLSLSAHKIGGIKGIGALYIREARELDITPVIHGAGQEIGLRGGTVATPLVASLGKACEIFPERFKSAQFSKLRNKLTSELVDKAIKYEVNGVSGLPQIVSLTLPEIDVMTFLLSHREKFALAQGSACSSKDIEASHVLKSLGFDRDKAERTIRLSFDFSTSENSIVELVKALHCFVNQD